MQSNVPVQVSGCEQQTLPPQGPTGRSMTPPAGAQRLAEAGRARAEAMCRCAFGELDESCIIEEDAAPTAACLAALVPDPSPRLDCRATGLWQDAECYARQACPGNAALAECPPRIECPPDDTLRVESYCRRVTCVLDQEQNPSRYQICDGVTDCQDGSDERNCTPGTRLFECATGSVTIDRVCDGVRDCDDGSDEQYCF